MTAPNSTNVVDNGTVHTNNGSAVNLGALPATSAPQRTAYVRHTGGPVVDNPTPHRLPEGENAAPLEVIGTTASDKLVIIMVGLPATGT
jgi:hypothetical protein